MAKEYPAITDDFRAFIEAQQMFFVASAPLGSAGHVNLSPKGLDCLRVLGPNRVAYLDLTGSGNETSAHLLENGRITFMFCAFDGPPRILRLYGSGETVLPGTPAWADLRPLFPDHPGARQIILAEVAIVKTSCGFAVPLYEYTSQREVLTDWARSRGEAKLDAYRAEKNMLSMDNMPTAIAVEAGASEPA